MIRNDTETMTAAKNQGVKKPLTVTLPPEFLAKIEEQKKRESRSASEIIREALRVYYGIGHEEPTIPTSGARHRASKS